jgi:uncharacterized protein YdhG (YjbR/CyaY superfamily)
MVESVPLREEAGMEAKKVGPATVDEYIAQFPEGVQRVLAEIRAVIREAAPGASERISYQMPAFFQNGVLVWFAAHRHHVGFYPGASGIEAFKERLSGYRWAKGSVQFPLDEPMPYELIREMVRYRVAEKGTPSRGRAGKGT